MRKLRIREAEGLVEGTPARSIADPESSERHADF